MAIASYKISWHKIPADGSPQIVRVRYYHGDYQDVEVESNEPRDPITGEEPPTTTKSQYVLDVMSLEKEYEFSPVETIDGVIAYLNGQLAVEFPNDQSIPIQV